MNVPPFLISRYFAHWEQRMPDLLCAADIEAYKLDELFALADEECRSLWKNLALGYTTTQGHPLIRAEIAALYQGIEPDTILTFAGGEEAIFVLFNILLQPGDHIIVVWPTYQSLYEVARSIGVDVTLIPLSASDGWSLDIEAILKAVRPNTRAIVTNFPNAPTGALPGKDIFAALTDLARDNGMYLLSDESFRFLEYDQSDRLPAAAECYTRGISIGSMSKAFALAGLRIGWLVIREQKLLQRALSFKDYTSVGNSTTSEILALIGLRAQQKVLDRNLKIIADNLVHLDLFFSNWPHIFTWIRPRAGSTGFPRLLLDMSVEHFSNELVSQENVLVLPGSVYSYAGNHFRIGFGRLDLPEALARLENFTIRQLNRSINGGS